MYFSFTRVGQKGGGTLTHSAVSTHCKHWPPLAGWVFGFSESDKPTAVHIMMKNTLPVSKIKAFLWGKKLDTGPL